MTGDIGAWLEGLGLGRYAAAFAENEIDLLSLPHVTEQDLTQIGVALGARRLLLAAIGELGKSSAPAGQDETAAGDVADSGSEAERRHLTVMFCDLVGSTALSERLDPEDLSKVIASFQDACASVVADFAGYVARLMGDGMLVYFGYPTAQEDAAERSVRVGLGIVDRVTSLSAPSGQGLHVRVGVATGLVVVGDLVGEKTAAERAVVGETPNLAARLQGLAATDTVVVAPATERLLGGLFEFEDLGEHDLKGFSEPVRAFRALHPTATLSRFEAYRGASLTPLVGRQEEIAFLTEKWNQARSGEGQVVTLSGEAGIGKSRIIEAIRAHAAESGGEAIHFQCSPHHQSTALYPFTGYLNRLSAAHAGQGGKATLAGLEALVRSSDQPLTEVVPLFAELISLPLEAGYAPLAGDAELRRNSTLRALADHVRGLCASAPLLLVFEDVHWIDPTSGDLLSQMIEQAAAAPVLILVTYRPGFTSPWGAMGVVAQLTLNRLGGSRSAEIALALTGGTALPSEVLDHIIDRADGIPLFVEEMTKSILDSGLLTPTDQGFVLEGRLSDFAVPETLQDSLMARLDRLAPVKEVAQLGAVIGREFGHPLLAAVSNKSDAEVRAAIDTLTQAELVFRRGWPPDEVYVFKHALVQDAAYESLLKERRRELHAAVAQALQERFAEVAAAEPETVAHHLESSGDPTAASGYWAMAGRRAVARSAHVEAVEHFRAAIGTTAAAGDADGKDFFELNMSMAGSLRVLGRSEETLKVLEGAQDLAETAVDRSRVHHLRGNVFFLKGDAEQNLAEQEAALRWAREGASAEHEVHALSGLADAAYMQGRMATAHSYFSDLTNLARQQDLLRLAAGNSPALINTRYLTTGPANATEAALEAIELVERQHHPRAEIILVSTVAEIMNDQLRFAEALVYAKRAQEVCERIGAKVWMPTSIAAEAHGRWLMGERSDGLALARRAAELALADAPALAGPWCLSYLALSADRPEIIAEVRGQAAPIFEKGCVGHNQIWFHRNLMDACLRFEDWDGVDHHADALADFLRHETFVWSEFFVARGRAMARCGRGDRSPQLAQEIRALAERATELGFLASRRALDEARL